MVLNLTSPKKTLLTWDTPHSFVLPQSMNFIVHAHCPTPVHSHHHTKVTPLTNNPSAPHPPFLPTVSFESRCILPPLPAPCICHTPMRGRRGRSHMKSSTEVLDQESVGLLNQNIMLVYFIDHLPHKPKTQLHLSLTECAITFHMHK